MVPKKNKKLIRCCDSDPKNATNCLKILHDLHHEDNLNSFECSFLPIIKTVIHSNNIQSSNCLMLTVDVAFGEF